MRTEHSLCTFTLSESSDARGWQTLRVRWSVSQRKCWLDRVDGHQTTMRDTKAMGVAVEGGIFSDEAAIAAACSLRLGLGVGVGVGIGVAHPNPNPTLSLTLTLSLALALTLTLALTPTPTPTLTSARTSPRCLPAYPRRRRRRCSQLIPSPSP